MGYNWRYHYISEDMAQQLFEKGLVKEEDLLKVRWEIQRMLEEQR